MGGVSMEWKEVRLGDVCNIITGFPFPGKKYSKEGIRVVRGDNVTIGNLRWDTEKDKRWNEPFDKTEYYSLQANDIVIGMDGSRVGKNKARIKEEDLPLLLAQRVACVRHNELAEQDYLYYNIFSKKFIDYVNSIHTGSAIPHISQKQIEDYKILLPNLETQRRIATILSSLDRKIELNNKINADLEEMAQAIFKNWLSECSDDVTIGELSLNITNYEKTDAEEVVLINSSDVTEGYFDHHNYSPNKNLKGHFKKRFQKGDILYSQVRPRNRHWAYCNFDANDYLASTQLMVIRNNPSLITSILLYQYIISDNVWKEFTLKTETRSGTFPQGNYEDLSQIRVPYNSDVEGISNQLETLYAKMFMLEKENSRLSLLRDTLLPRLISGEIEVPE